MNRLEPVATSERSSRPYLRICCDGAKYTEYFLKHMRELIDAGHGDWVIDPHQGDEWTETITGIMTIGANIFIMTGINSPLQVHHLEPPSLAAFESPFVTVTGEVP